MGGELCSNVSENRLAIWSRQPTASMEKCPPQSLICRRPRPAIGIVRHNRPDNLPNRYNPHNRGFVRAISRWNPEGVGSFVSCGLSQFDMHLALARARTIATTRITVASFAPFRAGTRRGGMNRFPRDSLVGHSDPTRNNLHNRYNPYNRGFVRAISRTSLDAERISPGHRLVLNTRIFRVCSRDPGLAVGVRVLASGRFRVEYQPEASARGSAGEAEDRTLADASG